MAVLLALPCFAHSSRGAENDLDVDRNEYRLQGVLERIERSPQFFGDQCKLESGLKLRDKTTPKCGSFERAHLVVRDLNRELDRRVKGCDEGVEFVWEVKPSVPRWFTHQTTDWLGSLTKPEILSGAIHDKPESYTLIVPQINITVSRRFVELHSETEVRSSLKDKLNELYDHFSEIESSVSGQDCF